MKKLSKYEIAKMIEKLPGNVTWGLYSMMRIMYENFKRDELINMYNDRIDELHLNIDKIA